MIFLFVLIFIIANQRLLKKRKNKILAIIVESNVTTYLIGFAKARIVTMTCVRLVTKRKKLSVCMAIF